MKPQRSIQSVQWIKVLFLASLVLVMEQTVSAQDQGAREKAGERPLQTSSGRRGNPTPIHLVGSPLIPLYRTSWALVIGISDYQDPRIPPLTQAQSQAEAVQKILVDQLHFPPDQVQVLTNQEATRERIQQALRQLMDRKRVQPEDRILIYFSGHGMTIPTFPGDRLNFLLPYEAQVDLADADPSAYLDQGLALKTLYEQYGQVLPAKHVLLLIDASYMEPASSLRGNPPQDPTALQEAARKRGVQIITAVSGSSPDSPARHGVLTARLLEAWATGEMAGPDGVLTTSELFLYLQKEGAKPTAPQGQAWLPQYAAQGVGEFLWVPEKALLPTGPVLQLLEPEGLVLGDDLVASAPENLPPRERVRLRGVIQYGDAEGALRTGRVTVAGQSPVLAPASDLPLETVGLATEFTAAINVPPGEGRYEVPILIPGPPGTTPLQARVQLPRPPERWKGPFPSLPTHPLLRIHKAPSEEFLGQELRPNEPVELRLGAYQALLIPEKEQQQYWRETEVTLTVSADQEPVIHPPRPDRRFQEVTLTWEPAEAKLAQIKPVPPTPPGPLPETHSGTPVAWPTGTYELRWDPPSEEWEPLAATLQVFEGQEPVLSGPEGQAIPLGGLQLPLSKPRLGKVMIYVPYTGAEVRVWSLREERSESLTWKTLGDGKQMEAELPAGSYRITLRVKGFAEQPPDDYPDGIVTVPPDELTTVTFFRKPWKRLKGRAIVHSSPSGAQIEWLEEQCQLPSGEALPPSWQTGEERELPIGRYAFRLVKKGFQDPGAPHILEVVEGESLVEASIELVRETGTLVFHSEVAAEVDFQLQTPLAGDEERMAELHRQKWHTGEPIELPTGPYKITLTPLEPDWYDATTMEMTVRAGGRIETRVSLPQARGKVILASHPRARRNFDPPVEEYQQTWADDQEMELPVGTYSVTLTPAAEEARFYRAERVILEVTRRHFQIRRLTGEKVKNTVSLKRKTGKLTVWATDGKTGERLSGDGVRLRLEPLESQPGDELPEELLTGQANQLPAGWYTLAVEAEGYREASQMVEIRGEQELEIPLQPGLLVIFRGVDKDSGEEVPGIQEIILPGEVQKESNRRMDPQAFQQLLQACQGEPGCRVLRAGWEEKPVAVKVIPERITPDLEEVTLALYLKRKTQRIVLASQPPEVPIRIHLLERPQEPGDGLRIERVEKDLATNQALELPWGPYRWELEVEECEVQVEGETLRLRAYDLADTEREVWVGEQGLTEASGKPVTAIHLEPLQGTVQVESEAFEAYRLESIAVPYLQHHPEMEAYRSPWMLTSGENPEGLPPLYVGVYQVEVMEKGQNHRRVVPRRIEVRPGAQKVTLSPPAEWAGELRIIVEGEKGAGENYLEAQLWLNGEELPVRWFRASKGSLWTLMRDRWLVGENSLRIPIKTPYRQGDFQVTLVLPAAGEGASVKAWNWHAEKGVAGRTPAEVEIDPQAKPLALKIKIRSETIY